MASEALEESSRETELFEGINDQETSEEEICEVGLSLSWKKKGLEVEAEKEGLAMRGFEKSAELKVFRLNSPVEFGGFSGREKGMGVRKSWDGWVAKPPFIVLRCFSCPKNLSDPLQLHLSCPPFKDRSHIPKTKSDSCDSQVTFPCS